MTALQQAPRRTPRDGGRDPRAAAPTGPEPPAAGEPGRPEHQVARLGHAAGPAALVLAAVGASLAVAGNLTHQPVTAGPGRTRPAYYWR